MFNLILSITWELSPPKLSAVEANIRYQIVSVVNVFTCTSKRLEPFLKILTKDIFPLIFRESGKEGGERETPV